MSAHWHHRAWAVQEEGPAEDRQFLSGQTVPSPAATRRAIATAVAPDDDAMLILRRRLRRS